MFKKLKMGDELAITQFLKSNVNHYFNSIITHAGYYIKMLVYLLLTGTTEATSTTLAVL